jgi:hypothetical protein
MAYKAVNVICRLLCNKAYCGFGARMRFLLRALFFSLLLYACYLLVSAAVSKDSKLPTMLQGYAENALQQYLCQAPVAWRIGELDPAFALTPEQAEQTAHNAATQWNQAAGFELFRYDSIDGFPINFAYDERQQQLLQHALLQRNLERYDSNIDQRVNSLQLQYARLIRLQKQFDQLNQQFAADLAAFEQTAQQASASNRAALLQQQNQLSRRQQQLQQQADELNAEQQRLQREQSYIDATVADRNALLPQQAEAAAPTEVGLMTITGRQRVMTIFAYKTLADLQLTMAHEFGHALGVGHTDSVTSVMHHALSSRQNQLTADDIQALQHQCGFTPH